MKFDIDDILTPLALTVIVDNKIRDPELAEFVVQAEGVLDLLGHGENLSPSEILRWFDGHEAAITSQLKSAGKNTFILKTLTRFKDNDALIEAMYDAMLAISVSDKEYHKQESALIKSTASLWGYVRPPFKVTPGT